MEPQEHSRTGPVIVSNHRPFSEGGTSGPEYLIISKVPVRHSLPKSSKTLTPMARTKKTADSYNIKNVSEEELAKWTPIQRARYWQGVADRRKKREDRKKKREAKKKVMTKQDTDLLT
jgi:hypothetical protein